MPNTYETNARLAEMLKELAAKFQEISDYADANDLEVYFNSPVGIGLYYDGKNTEAAESNREAYGNDMGWYSSSSLC